MGRGNVFVVKGGRVRVRCSRCNRVQWHSVPLNIRHKTVRCRCGKNTRCMFEYRKNRRKSYVGVANIEMCHIDKVYLCDMSSTGIGFIVKGSARSFRIGQELSVRYRNQGGKKHTRRICVANISANRVGARYIDIPAF